MRTKIRYTTVLLAFIFAIIPIVCILMIHHLTLTETLSKMGNGSLGESSSLIKVNGTIDTQELIKSSEIGNIKIALYIDENDDDGTIRNIYFNKDYVNIPMKSGRFFKKSDFSNGTSIAVVGKNREDETYINTSGESCILINDMEYSVIGVIGYEQATILDDYIYVNLNSLDNVENPLLTIDYLNSRQCDMLSEIFINNISNYSVSSEIISGNTSFSDSIMPTIVSARWFLCIIICCFICLLLTSVQWINSQRKEITIRMLVGASSKDIAVLIIKKYLLISALAFLIGCIYCNIFYPVHTVNLFYGYVFSMIFIIAFLLWSLYYLLHINIQEALK